MRFLLIILFLLVLGGLLIINNNELHVYGKDDFSLFLSMYKEWIGKVYSNVRLLTGNVVRQEWSP